MQSAVLDPTCDVPSSSPQHPAGPFLRSGLGTYGAVGRLLLVGRRLLRVPR